MRKQPRDADPESLLLVLCALGAGVEKFADVPDALARRKEELKNRKVEPVMVAWDGELGNRKFEFGYHTIEVKGQETFVISAPVKAYDVLRRTDHSYGFALPRSRFAPGLQQKAQTGWSVRRTWGVFAPIYALHSKRNPVAGDLTDFEQLMDWMGTLGGTVAATLPLLGAFLNRPFEPSPYSPAT